MYDYGQVIRLKPNAPEPYNSRARLYFNFSQRDSLLKALSNYNKAIELKEDVEYVVNRGATYAKLGNFEKSLEQNIKIFDLKTKMTNNSLAPMDQ